MIFSVAVSLGETPEVCMTCVTSPSDAASSANACTCARSAMSVLQRQLSTPSSSSSAFAASIFARLRPASTITDVFPSSLQIAFSHAAVTACHDRNCFLYV